MSDKKPRNALDKSYTKEFLMTCLTFLGFTFQLVITDCSGHLLLMSPKV
jgi:hypothetical protein